ncbi:MAG: DUF2497 domain-containing protein [Acidocella sp.]|nr:DUF2497 domain-containing protein [Acidocella sp.]
MTPNSDQPTPGGAGEPSMEDILASIRRILKDEAVPPVEGEPEEDVLVLDSSMVAKPVDLTSATMPPAAEDSMPLSGPASEPGRFASEPSPFAAPYEPSDDLNTPFRPMPLPDPRFSTSPTEAPAEPAAGNLPPWPAMETPAAAEPAGYRPLGGTPPTGMPVFGHRTIPDFPSMGGAVPPAYTPLPFPAPPPITPGTAAPPVFGSKFSPNLSNLSNLPPSLQPVEETIQSTTPDSTAAEAPEPMPTPVETPMPETNENHVTAPNSLIDDQVSTAAASAIGAMVRSISAEKSVAVSRGGATIEDMVREEIRPLLKAWLDTNLQSLVERVVRTEIEKVVSRSLD